MNGTSVGLHAGRTRRLPLARSAPGQVALDFVYGDDRVRARPRATRARGSSPASEILVRQGALAFALWTGRARARGG